MDSGRKTELYVFHIVTGCGNIKVFFFGFYRNADAKTNVYLGKSCALNLFVAIVLMRETLIGILSSDSLSCWCLGLRLTPTQP